MARRPVEKSNFLPYHVTLRTNNQERFYLPLEKVWKVFAVECWKAHVIYGVELHAFVLMPNHIHCLVTTPAHELGEVMNVFVSSVSRSLNFKSGRTGHVFGSRYYGTLIKNNRYFGHALKYVYRNPVKAGLCKSVEDHPFSTVQGLRGHSHLPFPLFFTRPGLEIGTPDPESEEYLAWLNQPFPKEAEELIQKSLRKRIMKVRDRKTRKMPEILDRLL